MAVPISITEAQVFAALGSVLGQYGLTSSATGQTVPIVLGQTNRVPQVRQTDFCVMWAISRIRLAQNIIELTDNSFTGSVVNNVLTVSALLDGDVPVGQPVYAMATKGGTIPTFSTIQQLTGPAQGIGTYSTTPSQDITSRAMYAGVADHMQKIEFTAQVDVHGPSSADNATRISTLWRDQFTIDAFRDLGIDVSPLYAEDPKQMPFVNEQQQTENRWVVDLAMQINPVVSTTAQFADERDATVTSVETVAIP